uniref:Conotoxin Vn5.6 n=1 Tax=Conus ventricosus TaxID=117992 RepID=CT56_CONVE|nr:RecName: Full=Conotoxin Vn5.6; AltName: Full=Conotoxin VnMLCL-022; Flags: Precursor [Conus ventricosus]AAG60422.1 conotoxin scaffold IX precursor [Conus ventricosus]
MLCLPVFIILLLLASPAAPNPLEKRIQSDLIRAALEDADMKTGEREILNIIDSISDVAKQICCQITVDCCVLDEE